MLKEDIVNFARERGADLVGFADADAWNSDDRVSAPYRPVNIWPDVRSVIVLGIEMPLPVVDTTPSVQHRDFYNACNRRLDDLALDLARWLNRRGHASLPLGRDGYANITVLIEHGLRAAFSHTGAARHAGLGTIGINNTILTTSFGPRVRFVSVFTATILPADGTIDSSLCIRCGACVRHCPVDALAISGKDLKNRDSAVARYDRDLCARWARELTRHGCYPCGICVKVCPVGDDRILYGREKPLSHYGAELNTPTTNYESSDPLHRSWMHQRLHGSSLLHHSTDSPGTFGDRLMSLAKKIKEER